MKRRIYVGIFCLAILTTILISAIFGTYYVQLWQQQSQKEIRTETISIALGCEMSSDPVSFLKRLSTQSQLRITLIAEDGNVLYDSLADETAMENHLERPEIRDAKQKGEGYSTRLSETMRRETHYYAKKLENGNYLRLSSETDSILQLFIRLLPMFGVLTVMILVCSFLVAHKLAGKIVREINAIDLQNPTQVIPFEELWPLLNRIEKQNRQIREQMTDLLEQERKFMTISQNMNEGLILLDTNSRIQFVNQSCKRLFDMEGGDYIGKHISLFNGSQIMQETVDASLKGNTYSAVLKQQERELQFLGNPVVEQERISGVVLFILDITEKQKAEKLRREFSANVSHELKTPLTSISGYAELLQNGLVRPEDVADFAGKIYKEAARLITLVNDIIKISQLDEKDIHQSKEQVDLYAVSEEVIQRLLPVAERQNVKLILEGEHVSEYLVRQMMYDLIYNLCENGIKYNKEQGSVRIWVTKKEGRPMIQVKDTGIGIPMEYQERVFERFYRIDKSHSKQTGGTGLGLSIVKHVVEYHGGYIEIHSNQEEGTTITIHL